MPTLDTPKNTELLQRKIAAILFFSPFVRREFSPQNFSKNFPDLSDDDRRTLQKFLRRGDAILTVGILTLLGFLATSIRPSSALTLFSTATSILLLLQIFSGFFFAFTDRDPPTLAQRKPSTQPPQNSSDTEKTARNFLVFFPIAANFPPIRDTQHRNLSSRLRILTARILVLTPDPRLIAAVGVLALTATALLLIDQLPTLPPKLSRIFQHRLEFFRDELKFSLLQKLKISSDHTIRQTASRLPTTTLTAQFSIGISLALALARIFNSSQPTVAIFASALFFSRARNFSEKSRLPIPLAHELSTALLRLRFKISKK